jgi:hypothetical protein
MRKILDAKWFNMVGIVRVDEPHEGIKYYIRNITGEMTEAQDMEYIADWGNTFPNDAGDVLFGVTSESKHNVHEWTDKRHY